jgi:hypothetical protein
VAVDKRRCRLHGDGRRRDEKGIPWSPARNASAQPYMIDAAARRRCDRQGDPRPCYNTSELWHHERQPNWSDTEGQIRNWLYYTWLSGDHIVEQFIHNIDAINKLQGRPVRVTPPASANCGQRRSSDTSTITSPCRKYADGVFCTAMCRQQAARTEGRQ